MIKNKGRHLSKKISNFKSRKKRRRRRISDRKKKIQRTTKNQWFSFLKSKFKSKKREKNHTSQNSGTTKH